MHRRRIITTGALATIVGITLWIYWPTDVLLRWAVDNERVGLARWAMFWGVDPNARPTTFVCNTLPNHPRSWSIVWWTTYLGLNPRHIPSWLLPGTPRSSYPEPLLMVAVKKGNRNLVEALVKNGARNGFIEASFLTPLAYAAKEKRLDLAMLLYEYGSNKLNDCTSVNRLDFAVRCGQFEIAEFILSIGVPVDGADAQGYSPLARAIERTDFKGTKFLLAHGADPDIVCMREEPQGRRISIVAWLQGRISMLQRNSGVAGAQPYEGLRLIVAESSKQRLEPWIESSSRQRQ